jgi:SAM-dependent methyltransferase
MPLSSIDYEAIWQDVWGDMQRFGPFHRHHRRIFGKMIKQIPQVDISTAADIGCGEGSNLLYLQKKFPGARLFGFDISHAAIEKARCRVKAKFSVLDIEKEYPPENFDIIICSDVLEHVNDDASAIKNIYRATKKYALIASVQGRMRKSERSIGHVRNYGYGELKSKLESVGFRTLSVVEWGFPLYSPIYRNLFDSPNIERVSHGQYGSTKKFVCNLLYLLFFLNRYDRGDVVFVLVCK